MFGYIVIIVIVTHRIISYILLLVTHSMRELPNFIVLLARRACRLIHRCECHIHIFMKRTGDQSRERGKHRGQARIQASVESLRDRQKGY